jgi:hypothetical protein
MNFLQQITLWRNLTDRFLPEVPFQAAEAATGDPVGFSARMFDYFRKNQVSETGQRRWILLNRRLSLRRLEQPNCREGQSNHLPKRRQSSRSVCFLCAARSVTLAAILKHADFHILFTGYHPGPGDGHVWIRAAGLIDEFQPLELDPFREGGVPTAAALERRGSRSGAMSGKARRRFTFSCPSSEDESHRRGRSREGNPSTLWIQNGACFRARKHGGRSNSAGRRGRVELD